MKDVQKGKNNNNLGVGGPEHALVKSYIMPGIEPGASSL